MKIFSVFFVLLLAINFLHPSALFAEQLTQTTNNEGIGCVGGFNNATAPSLGCLAQVATNAIQWTYGFSLLAGIGYFIFGGITFMMAQDEKGIKAGRDKMIWSIAGFVFIVLSFMIIRTFILLLGLPDILSTFSFFVPKELVK